MLHLASNQAKWDTGQTLVVDGGMALRDSGEVMETTWQGQ